VSTETNIIITVADIPVEVVKKDIQNLHVGVYPPNGRVRVAAPAAMSDEAIRLAVVNRLGWIKRQIHGYQNQSREPDHELASGESHYYLGQRYRLDVVEQDRPRKVEVKGKTIMTLYAKPGDSTEQKEKTLQDWYRERLSELVPPILEKWEQKLGVKANEWAIKRMKTKWGTCNTAKKRVWLNLELAKQPPHLIEYIVVHELAHLIEDSHGTNFRDTLNRVLPNWSQLKNALNNSIASYNSRTTNDE
jgi:predicted metal-dependent hydrolase